MDFFSIEDVADFYGKLPSYGNYGKHSFFCERYVFEAVLPAFVNGNDDVDHLRLPVSANDLELRIINQGLEIPTLQVDFANSLNSLLQFLIQAAARRDVSF